VGSPGSDAVCTHAQLKSEVGCAAETDMSSNSPTVPEGKLSRLRVQLRERAETLQRELDVVVAPPCRPPPSNETPTRRAPPLATKSG